MKTCFALALSTAMSLSVPCAAESVSACDTALAPTIESASLDYGSVQAYMSLNAAKEYDRLQKASASERAASASYKFFGAEYSDSKSSSEFEQRVRERLTKENFHFNENLSKASYRQYLSEAQLNAWSKCVQSVTGSGAVLVYAASVGADGFPIKVKWIPQTGVGSGQLRLRIARGKIDGQTEIRTELNGASERAFIVVPDKTTKNNTEPSIVLTAEIRGVSDIMVLPLAFERPKRWDVCPNLPGAQDQIPQGMLKDNKGNCVSPDPRAMIAVPASSFVRPRDVALGGPNNSYGVDVLLNAAPYGARPNAAEWEFSSKGGGWYRLKFEYAAAAPRPCRVWINGEVVAQQAMAQPTGCWEQQCQTIVDPNLRIRLRDGINIMRVERDDVFPHIRRFWFEPVD